MTGADGLRIFRGGVDIAQKSSFRNAHFVKMGLEYGLILVLSRFRVANGMVREVQAAFQERPQLVENADGYLGLEVFQDQKDQAMFYLLTRWTDEGSYRRWHSGPMHHQSHRLIPKGLKLEAAETTVVQLDRLQERNTSWRYMVADFAVAIGEFLSNARTVPVVLASPDGSILMRNAAFDALVGCEKDRQPSFLWEYLTDSDAENLRRVVAGGPSPAETVALNFVRGTVAATLRCYLRVLPDSFFLAGELPVDRMDLMNAELLQLNNQLTVLTREQSRRAKELAAANRELEVARAAADEANRQKSLFLASMSHEIRTPMNGVIGMIRLLRDSQLTSEQTEHARIIHHSAEALLQVVNDILDFSKIEAGRIELAPVDFDLREELKSIIALLRVRAAEKSIDLQSMVSAEVPAAIRSDAGRIRQILLNLAGNAVKFTPYAGKVTIAAAIKDDRLRFEVADTGIGIAPEELARLFKPFSQATAGTSARYGGTGLGLSISKSLTELMGGEIGVESVPGRGSTFWFWVPLQAGQEGPGTPSLLKEPAKYPVRADIRILVADDDQTNQLVAAHLLKQLGYECDIVSDGVQAIESYRHTNYDMILMDCFMPGMDGIDAAAQIRNLDGHRVPIIAMTAGIGEEDRERCLAAGMDGFILKPVGPAALAELIASWVDPINGRSALK